jgi:hypothetical protein
MTLEMPRRWDELGYQLEGLLNSLFDPKKERYDLSKAAHGLEALTQHLFGEELLFRIEVDRAARHSAAHGCVPETLSATGRFYLGYRLMCALDFLGMVFPPQAQVSPFSDLPKQWTQQQAIEWLLVDLWTRRFDHWLKLNALGVTGPFPFYGTESADPDAAQ